MGGTPWSSKGCINCKLRKIKCDEEKPKCRRCIKQRLECQGFDNHSMFVGAPSLRESREAGTLILARNDKLPQKLHTERSTAEALQKQKRPKKLSRKQTDFLSVPHYSTIAARGEVLPATVHSGQAVQAQLLASVMHDKFATESYCMTTSRQGFFISSIANLPQRNQMTDQALLALSCIFLGKVHRDTPVLQHGLRVYNNTIRHMRSLLNRETYTNDLLYTVFILQETEGFHSPNGVGTWGVHVVGMNAIIKHYRQKAQKNPIIDAIYNHQQKLNIIFSSTGMNISKSEYEHVMEPTNGNPLLEILQITVSIGSIASLLDSINDSGSDLTICRVILHKLYGVQERLMKLRDDGCFGEDPSETDYAANRLQYTDYNTGLPSTEPLFGPPYRFSSHDHALLYMMFWAHLNVIHLSICRTYSIFRLRTIALSMSENTDTGRALEDLQYLMPEVHGDRLARAIPYCLQESVKFSCIQILIFTTATITAGYVEAGNREKFDWCQSVFRYVEARGFESAGHIRELSTLGWESRNGAGKSELIPPSLRKIPSATTASMTSPGNPNSSVGGT